jgi:hypothetical protein
MASVCAVVTDSLGLLSAVEAHAHVDHFVAMSRKTPRRKPSGRSLTSITAEKVFGWKNVHEHEGQLIGKKQDKLGRWRSAKVPDYSNDPTQAYAIDERIEQLGRGELYAKELARMTKAAGLPTGWATPEQKSRAAIKILSFKRMK